jgi:hypothetical protein
MIRCAPAGAVVSCVESLPVTAIGFPSLDVLPYGLLGDFFKYRGSDEAVYLASPRVTRAAMRNRQEDAYSEPDASCS